MKTSPKPFALFLLTALLLSSFTGCTGKDGEIYGQRKVLEYVDSICTEPYHLVDRELIEESPDNMEYSFMTDNRELAFPANSRHVPTPLHAPPNSLSRTDIPY